MDEYFRNRLSETNKNEVGPTFVYLFNHKASASFTEIFKGGRENYYGNVFISFIFLFFFINLRLLLSFSFLPLYFVKGHF